MMRRDAVARAVLALATFHDVRHQGTYGCLTIYRFCADSHWFSHLSTPRKCLSVIKKMQGWYQPPQPPNVTFVSLEAAYNSPPALTTTVTCVLVPILTRVFTSGSVPSGKLKDAANG